jgi:hypothetical protein
MTDNPITDRATDGSTADPVEALKADIETTRAELQDTVDELSDRLNPKTQLRQAAASLTDTTKRAATDAGSAAKHGAGHVQAIARNQVGHGRGRRAAVVAAALAVVGLVWWRRGRR